MGTHSNCRLYLRENLCVLSSEVCPKTKHKTHHVLDLLRAADVDRAKLEHPPESCGMFYGQRRALLLFLIVLKKKMFNRCSWSNLVFLNLTAHACVSKHTPSRKKNSFLNAGRVTHMHDRTHAQTQTQTQTQPHPHKHINHHTNEPRNNESHRRNSNSSSSVRPSTPLNTTTMCGHTV